MLSSRVSPPLPISRPPPVKYYSAQTSLCIVRTSRDHHRTVWSALSMLGPVNGEKVVARVVHCSGPSRPHS